MLKVFVLLFAAVNGETGVPYNSYVQGVFTSKETCMVTAQGYAFKEVSKGAEIAYVKKNSIELKDDRGNFMFRCETSKLRSG